jgi:hypothetical protein
MVKWKEEDSYLLHVICYTVQYLLLMYHIEKKASWLLPTTVSVKNMYNPPSISLSGVKYQSSC